MAKPTKGKVLDPSLTEPINNDAPPTIYGSSLTPELANAALNLSVDFVKQQQSLANKYILWHPYTLSLVFISLAVYLGPNVTLPQGTHSVFDFLFQLAIMNGTQIATSIMVVGISTSVVFTFLTRFTEDLFKKKSRQIVDTNGVNVFNVDLTKLAKREIKQKSDTNNTQIIVYRETPIALASIVENTVLSSKDSLVMGISSIGCRRVYVQSGIIEDLIDWALIRTKNIQQSGSYKADNSMKVLIDVYSFDKYMKETLKKKGFSLLSTYDLEDSKLLSKIYGVKRELWGVQFHFEGKKDK
ncbi:LAFE_0G06062g1_1 [Lachancea fermentati]|uniref:LAFE_0G06062g1_1 n=1 Tax=Lachancea fermentati TaxID=4955 RepID=A0A1G4MH46_LACFM|nr:LAFE_0G06062g1_1 [Lachancea fermentati]